jgi:TonB family protein
MMMLIPAVLITLGLTTGMTPQGKTVKGKVVLADSGVKATGAAVLISATSMGTVVDEDGNFTIDVEGDPEIVVSFVGYKTLKIKSSKIGKKPLKLQPTAYHVDLESVKAKDLKSVKVEKGVVILTPKEAKSVVDGNETSKEGEPVFYIVEDMPMLPGGKAALKKYIYSNLVYPESLKNKGIGGEVLVQFLVTTSGKLEDIRVTRSTNEGFDKAAMDVFKNMPDWNPGKQRGKAVNVQVVVPVKFAAEKS